LFGFYLISFVGFIFVGGVMFGLALFVGFLLLPWFLAVLFDPVFHRLYAVFVGAGFVLYAVLLLFWFVWLVFWRGFPVLGASSLVLYRLSMGGFVVSSSVASLLVSGFDVSVGGYALGVASAGFALMALSEYLSLDHGYIHSLVAMLASSVASAVVLLLYGQLWGAVVFLTTPFLSALAFYILRVLSRFWGAGSAPAAVG
jgi:hypothetical protein